MTKDQFSSELSSVKTFYVSVFPKESNDEHKSYLSSSPLVVASLAPGLGPGGGSHVEGRGGPVDGAGLFPDPPDDVVGLVPG